MRRIACVAVALAVLLIGSRPSIAAICFPLLEARPESAYHYFGALADSLTRTKEARDRVLAASGGKGRFSPTDAMVALKTAQQDYQCAASYLAPYRASKNEAIGASSQGAGDELLRMRDLTGALVEDIKAILDDPGSAKREGTRAERDAERTIAGNAIWQGLLVSVVLATHTIVEFDPSTQKASRFSLSSKQRKETIRRFEKAFGLSIRNRTTGSMPLETAVDILLKYLKNRAWKSHDDK